MSTSGRSTASRTCARRPVIRELDERLRAFGDLANPGPAMSKFDRCAKNTVLPSSCWTRGWPQTRPPHQPIGWDREASMPCGAIKRPRHAGRGARWARAELSACWTPARHILIPGEPWPVGGTSGGRGSMRAAAMDGPHRPGDRPKIDYQWATARPPCFRMRASWPVRHRRRACRHRAAIRTPATPSLTRRHGRRAGNRAPAADKDGRGPEATPHREHVGSRKMLIREAARSSVRSSRRSNR